MSLNAKVKTHRERFKPCKHIKKSWQIFLCNCTMKHGDISKLETIQEFNCPTCNKLVKRITIYVIGK